MTRDQHLEFCRRCTNREFDAQKGFICTLTKRIADFEGVCPNFKLDESVVIETPEPEPAPNHEVVQQLSVDVKEQLRKQQDVVFAIIGGLSAAIVSALIWAVITVATEYQIGYMAIGVGLLVGFAVRYFGAGVDQHFGFIGAFFSLAGCALGNLFSQIGFAAHAQSIGYFDVLSVVTIRSIVDVFTETFSPMDILFYGIAGYEGYKFAFRTITDDVIKSVSEGNVPPLPFAKYRLPAVCILYAAVLLGGYFISQGSSGLTTYKYENGARRSEGMLENGKEQGAWSYWSENGKLLYEGFYNKGKQDSLWHFYNEEGKLFREGSFIDNVQHGQWIDYNENGKVTSKGQFVMGRQEGPWEYYAANGNLIQKGNFHLDKREGPWVFNYENGNPLSTGAFHEDLPTGSWTYWFENGTKAQEMIYEEESKSKIINVWTDNGKQEIVNGQGTLRFNYGNGNISETGIVKDGYRSGIWTKFFISGKKQEEGEYINNTYHVITSWNVDGKKMVVNRNGTYENYYDSTGIVNETGMIKNGLREGAWKVMAPLNSSVIQEMTYVAGKLTGPFKSYFAEGTLHTEGMMKEDKREGEWKWYFESLVVESSITYKDGKKEGAQLFFNQEGELLRTEVYENGNLVQQSVAGN